MGDDRGTGCILHPAALFPPEGSEPEVKGAAGRCVRRSILKIALIMDASQSGKNADVFEVLKKSAEKYGHTAVNYGQYGPDEPHNVTTVTNSVLSSVVIASGAADFVISGCANGVGASIGMNAMPNLLCGILNDAADAEQFAEEHCGNSVCMPFERAFHWGGEAAFGTIFDHLFAKLEPVDAQTSPEIFALKAASGRSVEDVIRTLEDDLLKQSFGGRGVMDLLRADCRDAALVEMVEGRLAAMDA